MQRSENTIHHSENTDITTYTTTTSDPLPTPHPRPHTPTYTHTNRHTDLAPHPGKICASPPSIGCATSRSNAGRLRPPSPGETAAPHMPTSAARCFHAAQVISVCVSVCVCVSVYVCVYVCVSVSVSVCVVCVV